MIHVVAAAIGFVLGLAAHDLGVQALSDDRPLRPFVGTCPSCGTNRGWAHLRCPSCDRRMEREPVVAVVSGLVAVGFVNTIGVEWPLLAYLGFLLLTMALLVTDLEEFRIVDRLNLRGTLILVVVLATASVVAGDTGALWRGLLGAVAYFAGATVLWLLVSGKGFGAGDVKLAPQLGLFTAYISWLTLGWAVFAMAVIGGVIAVALLALGKARMKTELPYGPPMIIGAWLAIVLAGVGIIP